MREGLTGKVLRDPKVLVILLLLTLMTIGAYWQVRQFDFVSYDDNQYVLGNPHVNTGISFENLKWAFTSVHASNWHPVTWVSHMLDIQVFGLHPGAHHAVNLLLHLLNVLLLFFLLYRATGGATRVATRGETGAIWKSATVAALFAVHPLHVESVAWIAERKDVLSTFFLFLTIWSYAVYVRNPRWSRYVPVFVFYALGLMSKPMLVSLPFALYLVDYWPLRRFALGIGSKNVTGQQGISGPGGSGWFHLTLEKVPLFVLAFASMGITIVAQQGDISLMHHIPLFLRIENAVVAYGAYLLKTIWPASLAVLYPYPDHIELWKILVSGLVLLLISGWAVWKSAGHPFLFAGWFWYLGTLVPVIGLVQVGVQSMADRYTYIPLIGIFVAAVWGFSEAAERIGLKAYALAAAGSAVVVLLAVSSFLQTGYWKDSETLFNRAIQATSGNYVMHSNMGVLRMSQGRTEEALRHYGEALRIKPGDLEANYNMGNALMARNEFQKAAGFFEAATRIRADYVPAWNNLGICLVRMGEFEKAMRSFQEALRFDPSHQEARQNLELCQARVQKFQAAAKGPEKAVAGDRLSSAQGRIEAGMLKVKRGDLAGARIQFEEALKINPDDFDAHLNLGLVMALQQKPEMAIPHFRKAIQIKPKFPDVYNSLGVALAQTGNMDEAVKNLRTALRLNPKLAKAHNSLGVILAKSGKIEEGIEHLQEAVRLQPDYQEAKKNLEILKTIKSRN